MKREEIHWIPKKPKCEGSTGFLTVGLMEVKPALMLLLFGYGISVSIAVLEIVAQAIRQRYASNIKIISLK